MTYTYKFIKPDAISGTTTPYSVKRSDGAEIKIGADNWIARDYQEWVDAGGVTQAAE